MNQRVKAPSTETDYFGMIHNEAKLNHYYHACIGVLFKWLNRRSQKRS